MFLIFSAFYILFLHILLFIIEGNLFGIVRTNICYSKKKKINKIYIKKKKMNSEYYYSHFWLALFFVVNLKSQYSSCFDNIFGLEMLTLYLQLLI